MKFLADRGHGFLRRITGLSRIVPNTRDRSHDEIGQSISGAAWRDQPPTIVKQPILLSIVAAGDGSAILGTIVAVGARCEPDDIREAGTCAQD
jgi:hypothetical protein